MNATNTKVIRTDAQTTVTLDSGDIITVTAVIINREVSMNDLFILPEHMNTFNRLTPEKQTEVKRFAFNQIRIFK